jgi:hypothetical protein
MRRLQEHGTKRLSPQSLQRKRATPKRGAQSRPPHRFQAGTGESAK